MPCSDCPPAGYPTDKPRCAECLLRNADFEKTFSDFFERLAASQQPIGADFQKVLDDHWWEAASMNDNHDNSVLVELNDLAERWPIGVELTVAHDGFVGTVQGHYVTREGKPGLVLQQIGTKVAHVYGEKWFTK